MSISSFINGTDLSKVEQRYINQFNKVDELSEAFENLGSSYLPLTGGTLTGSLTVTDYININNDSSKITANGGTFALGNFSTVSNGYLKIGPASINNDTNFLHLNSGPVEIISNGSSKLFDISYASGSLLSVGFKFEQNVPLFYLKSLNDKIQVTQNSGFIDHISAYLFGPGQLISISQGVENSTQFVSHYSNYQQMWFKGSNPTNKSSYNMNITTEALYLNMSYGNDSSSMNIYTSTGSFIEAVNTYNYISSGDTTLYTSRINFDSWIRLSRKSDKTNLSNSFETTICSDYVSFGGIGSATDNDGINDKYYYKFGTFDAIFSTVGDSNTNPRLDTQGKYGIKFNLGYTNGDLGIRVINQQNENKRNFTITGFSDIINDKFTLSDTYDTSALTETLTEDEIAWINDNSKDILAMIISLKRSLDNNSEEETEDDRISSTILTTKDNTNLVALKLNQYENNAFTIDWGDGTTENTDGKAVGYDNSNFTLTHNYETAGVYNIGISLNSDTADGSLQYLDTSQFTSIQVYKLKTWLLYDDDIITYKVNTTDLRGGSGTPLIVEANSLTELVIGELAQEAWGVASNCPNLTKATLQINENFDSSGGGYTDYIFDQCPNLTEIHITSTIPFDGSMLMDTENIPTGLVIYVPSSAVDTYKSTASWSAFTSYIQGE